MNTNSKSGAATSGTATQSKQKNKNSELDKIASGTVSASAATNSELLAKGLKPAQNTATGSKAASMSKTATEHASPMTTDEGDSNTLEEKTPGETEEHYCKRVFSQRCGESEKAYVKRVFNKYDDETEVEYMYRIDIVLSVVQSKAFYNYNYKAYSQDYMVMKYQQQEGESEGTYFRRILTKKQQESFQIYMLRIGYLRKFIPGLSCWATFKFDKSSVRGYTLKNRKTGGVYYPHVM